MKTVAELIRHIAVKKKCRLLMIVRSMLADGHGVEKPNEFFILLPCIPFSFAQASLPPLPSLTRVVLTPRFKGNQRLPLAEYILACILTSSVCQRVKTVAELIRHIAVEKEEVQASHVSAEDACRRARV